MDENSFARARALWAHRGNVRPEWAVTPGPGQESVWDYPRPPRLAADSRLVRVLHEGQTIAESTETVRILETASPPTFYVPPSDVRTDLLERARGASICEWKGSATYWSLRSASGLVPNVAWSYETPFPDFTSVSGYLSFYPSKLECYVDDQRVKPQPGDFYGGWITSEIVGPFKGDPGTSGW
jgi:uncharacterized protein (DUF427 family)